MKEDLPTGIRYICNAPNSKQDFQTSEFKVGQFLVNLTTVTMESVKHYRDIFPRQEYLVLKKKMNIVRQRERRARNRLGVKRQKSQDSDTLQIFENSSQSETLTDQDLMQNGVHKRFKPSLCCYE